VTALFVSSRKENMNAPLSTDPDYNLWVLLQQTRDALFNAREKELRKYRISAIEAATLLVIQAIGDKATSAEISRWMFRKAHTVSALLDRMQKKGLVRKSKDLEWRNLVRVSITEKGKEAYNNSTSIESIHMILSALSEEERQQLRSYLQTLRDRALKEINIDYKLPFPSDM